MMTDAHDQFPIGLAMVLLLLVCSLGQSATTRPITGLLLDEKHHALAGNKVVLIMKGCSEDIADGVIHTDADCLVTSTDNAGRFAFGPTTRPAGTVAAVTSVGRAFAFADDVRTQKQLQVVPFSYIEGTVRIRNHIGAGETVNAWCWPTDGGSAEGDLGIFTFTVTADKNGHFKIPVLGREQTQIGRVQPINYGDNIPLRDDLVVPVATTIHRDLGGTGRLVIFNLLPPSGYALNSVHIYFIPDGPKIVPAEPDWPAESVRWDKIRQDTFLNNWKESPAAKSAIDRMDEQYRARNSKCYYGNCGADGKARLEDILPGKYRLRVQATGIDTAGKKRTLELYQPVTVTSPPDGEPDEPLDWGNMQMKLKRRLYAGDVAPDFNFPGVDGKSVKLSNFRGKVVLVHFWATWCGPCLTATPYLKTIDERFGNDPRFASIHVAQDETLPSVLRYISAENLKGIQAWSGPSDRSDDALAYGADAIPTMVLIGPDNHVLVVTHSAGDLMQAVDQALENNR